MCNECREQMVILLNVRMSLIMQDAHTPEEQEVAAAHCSHLLELRDILEAQRKGAQ